MDRLTSLSYCELCPAGHYSAAAASECLPCPPDTWTSKNGTAECEMCPLGSRTLREGSVAVRDCICRKGHYGSAGDVCPICPNPGVPLGQIEALHGDGLDASDEDDDSSYEKIGETKKRGHLRIEGSPPEPQSVMGKSGKGIVRMNRSSLSHE